MRNASSAIPAGVLKQTGGEPLSGQELADLAAQFNLARATNQTAALNEFLSYTETNATPDKMLLIVPIYSAKDGWLVEPDYEYSKTQATVNGGEAMRLNAYVDVSKAKVIAAL
jgi:hypothetical protein